MDPQPVSEISFSLRDGDAVSVFRGGSVLATRGRVFRSLDGLSFDYVSDDFMGNSSSIVSRDFGVVPTNSSERSVAYISIGTCGAVSVYKAFCPRCRHYVVVPGHPGRCLTDRDSHAVVDSYRRCAWLGDSLHLMDVRVVLLNMGVSSDELDVRLQMYTRASSQAAYLKSLIDGGVRLARPPLGASERQMSTAFEANYSGQFRAAYLRQVLDADPPSYDGLSCNELDSLLTLAPPAYAG